MQSSSARLRMSVSVTRRQLLQGLAALGAVAAAPIRASDLQPLRVGYQKAAGLLGLLKVQAKLQSVTWSEFPAGPQLLEALSAGSLDFGYTGAPPPIFAQAADVDLVYVGAEPVGLSSEAIVVKQQTALTKLSDLKGRSIAVQKGSSAHYLLLASLETAELRLTDVQVNYLPPAYARAAFDSDRVDAWAIWDPHLASMQASSSLRVLADYTTLSPVFGFYVATRRFAEQQRDRLVRLLDELDTSGHWVMGHPDASAEILAPQVGLSVAIAEVWQRRARYDVLPIDDHVTASQQRIADMFFSAGLIPKKIDVASAVWHRGRA